MKYKLIEEYFRLILLNIKVKYVLVFPNISKKKKLQSFKIFLLENSLFKIFHSHFWILLQVSDSFYKLATILTMIYHLMIELMIILITFLVLVTKNMDTNF